MTIRNHYRRNLRTAVGSSAAPYGYTLAIWTSGAVLTNAQGIPDTLAVLMFMVGAVSGFAFVGALAFGGVTERFDQERSQALLWGSLHVFSVGLAIAVATLVAYGIKGFIAWPVGGFLSTTIFLLILGAESTAAYMWLQRREE